MWISVLKLYMCMSCNKSSNYNNMHGAAIKKHSTCFGRSFRPSSGIQDCTYSNRYCCLLASKQTTVSVWHIPVAVCTVLNSWWWTERPSETCGVLFKNKINLRNWCHLVGFTTGIYYDAQPYERQIRSNVLRTPTCGTHHICMCTGFSSTSYKCCLIREYLHNGHRR
jgi:hypothetical protein